MFLWKRHTGLLPLRVCEVLCNMRCLLPHCCTHDGAVHPSVAEFSQGILIFYHESQSAKSGRACSSTATPSRSFPTTAMQRQRTDAQSPATFSLIPRFFRHCNNGDVALSLLEAEVRWSMVIGCTSVTNDAPSRRNQ